MKAYTDLSQSKKLTEILPLESADMHYNNVSIKGINYVDEHRAELMEYNRAIKVLSKYTINPLFEVVPCWSLAALLELIPNYNLSSEYHNHTCLANVFYGKEQVGWYDNPIDACAELILKLHELKML